MKAMTFDLCEIDASTNGNVRELNFLAFFQCATPTNISPQLASLAPAITLAMSKIVEEALH